MVHCADEVLLHEAEATSGYRNKITWSTATNNTRCMGDDRTFDKIVKSSIAKEKAEASR